MGERDGNDYVINGHKWYISGAIRPECKIFILLGKTRFDGPQHQQQSMILVPKDAPGINILRGMGVFGHIGDHAEIIFENVRVPATNMVLGEGRGSRSRRAASGLGGSTTACAPLVRLSRPWKRSSTVCRTARRSGASSRRRPRSARPLRRAASILR